MRSSSTALGTFLEDAMKKPMLIRFRLAAASLPVVWVMVTQPALRADADQEAFDGRPRGPDIPHVHTLNRQRGVERKVPLDIWQVEKVDGTNISIRAEKLRLGGWTPADQVIAIDPAMVYFADQIRDHPDDLFVHVMRDTSARQARTG